MNLPSSNGTSWYVHDYRQSYLTSAPASAEGVCQVELPQVPQDELWFIERLVVSSDSELRTQARLYLDAIEPARMLDGTRSGNFDVADQASPILIPGASLLLCQWTGATPDARGTLRAQLTILKQA